MPPSSSRRCRPMSLHMPARQGHLSTGPMQCGFSSSRSMRSYAVRSWRRLAAVIAALRRLDVVRMALATPYPGDVTDCERRFFVANGFDVVSCNYLGRSGAGVRPTTFDEIIALVRRVDRPEVQAIFISCTDLRVLELVDMLEQELSKPVLTSNQVTLWAILEALGRRDTVPGYGRLLAPS